MEEKSILVQKKCMPCEKGTPALKEERLYEMQRLLEKGGSRDWKIVEEHHLEKEYSFRNFKEALHFTNQVGALAEQEGHHPDLYLSYGKVKILLWTHKIGGLSENDFIFAAKCDLI